MSNAASTYHVDSCSIAAIDDELIDDGSIDWDWDQGPIDVNSADVHRSARSKKVSTQVQFKRSSATVSEAVISAALRIHATIESLIAGEKIVQQTKAHTLTRLADTLEIYDSMVDDVIRCINDTRVGVKDEIRGMFECAVKRLDGQIDELAVSIGQLQGLADILTRRCHTPVETVELKLSQKLLSHFRGPVCDTTVSLPRASSDDCLAALLSSLSKLTVTHAKSLEGVHVATLPVRNSRWNVGLAVNDDATLMAVSNEDAHTVTVYELPSGDVQAEFGSEGFEKGCFNGPSGLCFTVDDTLLVADCGNKRIIDISTGGVYQRTIGRSILAGNPIGVAANEEVIVVSQNNQISPRIVVMEYRSGRFIRSFGELGADPGQLNENPQVCISPDGRHIVVAENYNRRLSLFSLSGAFVKHICVRDARGSLTGVCFGKGGEIIAAGFEMQEIVVFSEAGDTVLKRFGSGGTNDGQFSRPRSVAFAAGRLYVLDHWSARVQVFE